MQHKRFLPFFFLPLLFAGWRATSGDANGIFSDCKQLVVVVSPNNKSVKAKLFRFEKRGKTWKQAGPSHPVNLGKKGLAWGRGLQSAKPGVQKKEGDLKSPEGIFRFGTAFGYAPSEAVSLHLDYVPITEEDICVEDPESPYYNQIVKIRQATADGVAFESMLRRDEQYKWGIYVRQNLPAQAGEGSCIFFHCWRKRGSGTLGCTAMSEDNLLQLMQWLNPQQKPLLIQMTMANYRDYQQKFALPGVY